MTHESTTTAPNGSQLAALVLACTACGVQPQPVAVESVELARTQYDLRPQAPTILRDVAMIDDDVEWTHPFVPGHRTSMDGRVALRVQGGSDEVSRLNTNLSFFVMVPERLQEPIVPGPAGVEIMAETEPVDVPFPPALDPEITRLGHHTICDPTEEFELAGERTNPYVCGPGTQHDCYDLVVISSTSPGFGAQLWGTPVTVEIEHPKTAQARIVEVTLGEPVAGAVLPFTPEWTEPAVTADGRLLTGRLGRLLREWTHPQTGETLRRPYDLAYSVLPEGAAPCDVTGWTAFHPMSHAPYDPQMVGTYGLAAYPFRDTEGNPIADGEDMGGTYPWVDREGANVFMAGVHGRLSEQSEQDFPRRCVHDGCEALTENVDFDRGYMVAGLWTHGKLVHLDGMINALDWAVGVTPESHWWVDLYTDEAGTPVPVRLGSGRFIERFRDAGPYPGGYTHNPNILDSLQNLPNWRPQAQPVTPRDVVWIMSTGVATDEIAFDDFLDPAAIIVSNMQASITQLYSDGGESLAIPHQHNGQVRTLQGSAGVLAIYELDPGARDEIHVQNAATSLAWETPAYGRMEAGTARVEPVALGGIVGRGLWLSGDAAIHYPLADQPTLDDTDTTIGIFVDNRAAADEARELLSFSDGSGIVVRGDEVFYLRDGEAVHHVPLPASQGWVHLGWRIGDGHRHITLLHDGFALDRYDAPAPMFSLAGGEVVVGRHTAGWTGFRGWIDEFVVLAHDVNPEVACNHAKGTLVQLEDGADDSMRSQAGRYPSWAHAAVAEASNSAGSSFACLHDYREDYAVHLGTIPAGTRPLRDAINFPEGPLRAGVPRPDSSNNAFCTTCHTTEGQGGLGLDALVADPSTPAEHDRRRQPSQPPRRVFGNIPANWIPADVGPGSPAQATQAPAQGLLIDRWLLMPG